jgi:hypothetical protein
VERKMKGPALPKTDSIEELARFWDSHEVTEFEDQLEEVKEPVFEIKRGGTMVLRLELLREWVLEKLGSLRGGDLR